jgi:ATP-binding cassette subfamily B protein
MFKLIKAYLKVLPKERQWAICGLLALTVLSAFAEIFSVASVIPLVKILMEPEAGEIKSNYYILKATGALGISAATLIISGFLMSTLISMSIRVFWIRMQQRVAAKILTDVGLRFLSNVFYGTSKREKENVSDNMATILTKVPSSVYHVLNPILTMISSSFITIVMLFFLLYLSPLITLIVLPAITCTYLFVIKLTKSRVQKNAKNITEKQSLLSSVIHESVAGLQEIKMGHLEDYFLGKYKSVDVSLKASSAQNIIFSAITRPVIEAAAIILIVVSIFILEGLTAKVIDLAIIASFVLGIQKVTPLAQQIYSSYITVKGMWGNFETVVIAGEFEKDLRFLSKENLEFKCKVELENISVLLGENTKVLDGLNLVVNKGDKIGISGHSGCGKSTLLDVISGIRVPNSGRLIIDEREITENQLRSLRSSVAYVSQDTFLMNDTLLANITLFSAAEVDLDRLKLAIDVSQISDIVDMKSDGINQILTENGGNLSGGQRQRISLARAIYQNPEILVLDEATSALDDDTETRVVAALEKLDDLTVIIVSHRRKPLEICNRKLIIENGKIA